MEIESLWQDISNRHLDFPGLQDEIEADVLVIGGGITGITTAYELVKRNKSVVLIDAYQVGGIVTSLSTGNLYVPVQPYYYAIEEKFNLNIARQVANSRANAISYIEDNVNEHNIFCHFTKRPMYVFSNDDHAEIINKEFETLKRINLSEMSEINEIPYNRKFKKGFMLTNQARFNPLQYVISLSEIIAQKGGMIFENTRALNIIDENDGCTVKTDKGTIRAKKVVYATHTPLNFNPTQMFTKAYRSYVVAVRLKNDEYPDCNLWELNHEKFAISTHSIDGLAPQLLLVAGNHHRTGQGDDMKEHYDNLEKFLDKNFEVAQVVYKWSSQHFHAADDVPYIGFANHKTKNVYMATGYFADGLVYGTIAGLTIANSIIKEVGDEDDLFNPNRFKPFASLNFLVKENSNNFLQYAKDIPYFTHPAIDSIKPGEAKIIQLHEQKYGIYRDPNNQLHVVSAHCTHMKCIVNWNNAESSWDCPCHGSRFSYTGEVLEGPATRNLENCTQKLNLENKK